MPGPLISIGGVGIDVIPNAQGLYARLAPQVLPDAERVADEAGRAMGRRIQSGIADGVRDGMRAGGRAAAAQATREGSQAGGAFGRAMRVRLETALRALPNIQIGANTSQADADIQALRVRLESLRNQRIGIDIDAAQARTEAAEIEEQLRRLGATHPNVQMRVDTAAARAALAEFQQELDRLSRTSVSPRIEVEGGFAQRLRAAVEAAQAQLPVINVDASTSAAAAQVQALRAQLESLRTVRVGIDVDAATALARVNEIQARLVAISASDATADVRVDAAGAATALAAIQAQVAALDGDTARIDIDVSSAAAGLVRLTTLAAGVGPAVVPAFAAAAFGVGGFVSVLSTAVAGMGAFAAASAPGLIDVGKAVMATTAAEEALAAATDKTARAGAQQAITAQQQALAMEGAQASLANAQRSAAQQIADAQERVRDAAGRVSEAQERVAQAALRVVDAQERVADAERAVADAREQASLRMDAALDRITDAERSRTDAVRDAQRAELALVDARRAAQEQIEDLNARVEGGAVAERRAAQAVKRAREELDEVKASGAKADSDAAVEAQLAYDEAVLRLKDLQRENKRTKAESDAANKAQIDGNREVQDAQQGVVDAQQRVRDAADAVTEAQEAAQRTQVEGARAVADAQKGVVDAQRGVVRAQAEVARAEEGVARAREQVADAELGVARARVQGAEQIAAAERQVRSAQLAAAAAAEQQAAGVEAANTALDKQRRALAELSPEQRGVYDAVQRLKDGFKAWGDSLAPATMPLFTRFLDGITNSLPGLTPLVLAAAEGFNRLFDRAGRALQDPFWDRFRDNLVANIPRAIESMGVTFGNIFAGMAGVIDAFLPRTDQIGSSMERVTARFREWGQNLGESQGFKDFQEFLHEDWPGVSEAISDVGGALWQITLALAQVSPSAVLILQGVATAIENTPVWVIQTLVDAFFAWRLAVLGIAVVQGIYTAALAVYTAGTGGATVATWSFSTALRAIPLFGIIATLLTLAGTFVLLMIQSEDFRNKVLSVFGAMRDGAVWLWENGFRPAFGWIWDGMQWVGEKATWLWTGPVSQAFGWMSDGAMALYNFGLKPAFDLMTGGMEGVGRWAKKLHDDWIKPWFDTIAGVVGGVAGGFEGAFKTGKEGVERVWGDIKRVVAEPINWVIDKVYTGGIKNVWDAIAGKVGLPALPAAPRIDGYATGGIYPGYTPGRDVGLIGVSGGEAIIRPEGTRALGASWVHGLNAASRAGGVSGAKQFLAGQRAPFLGGFDLGGIVGGLGDTLGDIGGGIADLASDAKELAENLVRGAAAKVVETMLAPVRAMVNLAPDKPEWMLAAKKMPLALMDGIVAKIKDEDAKVVNGHVGTALGWAQTQAGKPYQWGGNGNPSWDCSGFMAAIQQVILGKKPSRLWTTFDFVGSSAPAGWVKDLQAPFMIGITNLGVGHTAGTLLGTNVESRGGDGVVVGPRARGWNDPMFYAHYGFAPSQAAAAGPAPTGALAAWISQALTATGTPPPGTLDQWMSGMAVLVGRESGGNPFATNTTDSNALAGNASRGLAQVVPTTFNMMHEPGTSWNIFDPVANLAAAINWIKYKYGNISNVQQANPALDPKGYALGGIIPLRAYDSGGPLGPGLTLAYNGTGKTEQTYTHEVNRALLTLAARGAAAAPRSGAAGGGAGVHIENYHQHTDHSPRQIAEEMHVLARARGPRR